MVSDAGALAFGCPLQDHLSGASRGIIESNPTEMNGRARGSSSPLGPDPWADTGRPGLAGPSLLRDAAAIAVGNLLSSARSGLNKITRSRPGFP
jgi:hypothetical protein